MKRFLLSVLTILVVIFLFVFYSELSVLKKRGPKEYFTLLKNVLQNKLFPTGSSQKEYEEGIVLVTFNDGVACRQVKDLFTQIDFIVGEKRSPCKPVSSIPSDSKILEKIDVFSIKVKIGKEDEVVRRLNQESIVRAASKSPYGHTMGID